MSVAVIASRSSELQLVIVLGLPVLQNIISAGLSTAP